MPLLCSIEGCDRPRVSRGWCRSHYRYWQRHGDPLAGRGYRVPIEERFWRAVQKGAAEECWNWIKFRNADGYGQFWDGTYRNEQPRFINAHRWLWIHLHGQIEDHLRVCHSCDNPSCCNPAHLFIGTQRDNMHDAIRKGRWNPSSPGEKNPRAKLTWEQVREMRSSYTGRRGEIGDLAVLYGVTRDQISKILLGKAWVE